MQEDIIGNNRRPTLRELEVLRTLIAYGKTTAAARKLNISQPAVSRAIHQLEQRTGLELFRRETGRLVPTAEALALYQQCEPIFLTFERLERVGWRPEEAHSVLRIVAPPTLTQWFLHPLLGRFLRSEPDTRIHIESRSGIDVVNMVANGDMDLGLADQDQDHVGVRLQSFRTSEACAVIPADWPLAEREEISPIDLHEIPLVALARRFQTRTRLDRLLLDAGAAPRIMIEASTSATAYEFAREGIGIAIINPFPVSFRRDHDVVLRPFRPAIAYTTSFVLPSMSPPTAVTQRFIDFVRQNQAEDGYSRALRAA